MRNNTRVRFAPSPTGPLHIGGLRTALYNYLFAKKHQGTFILRIEDTDQTRYMQGAEEYISEALNWTGLIPDEGPATGGDYGPYKQSERKDIYQEYAKKLIKKGHAYYAFDQPEALDRLRKDAEKAKKTFSYDASVREEMDNSLNLDEATTQKRIKDGEPFVIRFKMPANQEVSFNDMIRGNVCFNTNTLDDKIIVKSDGLPTYHLANIVDDHLMDISHVIRGEEWLPSTPLHLLLYDALELAPPEFAHLPLILKPSGEGKLSKRDGDKLGFPVFPLNWKDQETGEIAAGYRESGYYPESVINILALLGWNPGTEKELFTLEELTQSFTLNKVNKGGARFDPDKARWFNHQYLQQKSDRFLAEEFNNILQDKNIQIDNGILERIIGTIKERVSFVEELWEQSYFFFEAPQEYDPKIIKKRWKPETPDYLKKITELLKTIEPFSSENIEEKVKNFITENELNMGQVMNCLRLTIVGKGMGPHLFDILEIIGREESIKRIEKGINTIQK